MKVIAYFEDILTKCPEYEIPSDFVQCLRNLNLRLSSHWWCFSDDVIQRCQIIENHLKDLDVFSDDDLFVKCEYDFIRAQLDNLPYNACLYLLLRSIQRRKHLGDIFNSNFFSGFSSELRDDYDTYGTFSVRRHSLHSYQLLCKTAQFYIECRFKDVNFGEESRYFDCSFILIRFHWYRPTICIYCEQLIIFSAYCSDNDDQKCYSVCSRCCKYPAKYKHTIIDRDYRFCNNLNLKLKLISFKDILRHTIHLHNFVETLTHVKTICRERRSNDTEFNIVHLNTSDESTDSIVESFCNTHDCSNDTADYYQPVRLQDLCSIFLKNILCQDSILYQYAGPFKLRHLFEVKITPFLRVNRSGSDYWDDICYALKTPASSVQSSPCGSGSVTPNPYYDCSQSIVERFRDRLRSEKSSQE